MRDGKILSMHGHPELDAMARRVIDANHYMTLGTQEPDGRPRLSPVYYTAARYSDFYWVSSPEARHSRNVAERPEVQIVIFDSTALVGAGQAVYLGAAARAIPRRRARSRLSRGVPHHRRRPTVRAGGAARQRAAAPVRGAHDVVRGARAGPRSRPCPWRPRHAPTR